MYLSYKMKLNCGDLFAIASTQRYPSRWSLRDLRTGTDSTLPSSWLRSLWLSGPEQGRDLRKSSSNWLRSLWVAIYELWKRILLSCGRREASQWVLCKMCLSRGTAKVPASNSWQAAGTRAKPDLQGCSALPNSLQGALEFGGRHGEFSCWMHL